MSILLNGSEDNRLEIQYIAENFLKIMLYQNRIVIDEFSVNINYDDKNDTFVKT